jgi:hypothetical protein
VCACVRTPQLSVTRGLYFWYSFTEHNSTVFSRTVNPKLVHFRAFHPDSMPILVNLTVAPVTEIFHTILETKVHCRINKSTSLSFFIMHFNIIPLPKVFDMLYFIQAYLVTLVMQPTNMYRISHFNPLDVFQQNTI